MTRLVEVTHILYSFSHEEKLWHKGRRHENIAIIANAVHWTIKSDTGQTKIVMNSGSQLSDL